MAHKDKVTLEKARLMDARWINTPFAFAQLGRGFTLLQQHVMIKVSDHLQNYMSQFFRDNRHLLPDDPLSLFDDSTIKNIPPLKIPYSEFGVDVNNRKALYDAINEVLRANMKGIVVKDGVQNYAWINVFKLITTPVQDVSDVEYRNGSADFYINEELALYAFNMKRGYINHPLSIAQESTREYAPRLYFLVKHKLARGKKECDIPYSEVRRDLGADILDKTKNCKEDVIQRSLYPQFSKFCKYVLDPACEDINRMASLNLLDITISYKAVYAAGVTRGNPESIHFKVALSKLGEYHKNPKKAQEHMDSHGDTPQPAPVAPKKRGRPRKQPVADNTPSLFDGVVEEPNEPQLMPDDRVGEWQKLVKEYGAGPSAEILSAATCIGTLDDAFALQVGSRDAMDALAVAATSDARLKELLVKSVGRPFKTIQVSVNTNI